MNSIMFCAVLVIMALLLLDINAVAAKVDKDDCEVCIKFLTKFQKTLEEEGISQEPKIQTRLREECRKAKGKDNRFCYYIGGTDDSATGTIGDITKPCSYHMPPNKICANLKKKDAQICELRYEKQLDWKNLNLNKMRVKQLKKILSDWNEDCRGCAEKQDFVDRINKLKPQYVREEL